jgi:hypothetical protein
MDLRSFACGTVGAATFLLALAPATAQAQQPAWDGQIRPRFETRDLSGGPSDAFTSMRTRVGLDVLLEQEVSVFIQMQDVRVWGEETHPLFDFEGDAIDLHQAYVRYRSQEFEWLTGTVGRQETRLGGERLVGAVDWAQQGQSFDGVRLDMAGERGSASVLAYVISDETAATAGEDRQLFGLYGTLEELGPGALDVYWLFDRARDGLDTDEHSIGARYAVDGEITGRFEATVQSGTRAGADVSSFMFGARLGTSFNEGRATATIWYDYLSGDDPSTPEVEVFNTLYATNHKFYGAADIFTNIPAHTGGAGLQDIAAKVAFMPNDETTAALDVHTFLVAEQGGLSGAHLADELDLSLTRRLTADLELTGGLSFVFQEDPLGEIGRLSGDQRWFYLMLDAVF